MNGDNVVNAAIKVHNAGVLLGEGYHDLLAALDEFRKEAYREGGETAIEDFANVAGRERVNTDTLGLLISSGLRPLLQAAGARVDWKPNPNFAARFEKLVETDSLVTHRGQQNPDPLSAHKNMPGVKVRAND